MRSNARGLFAHALAIAGMLVSVGMTRAQGVTVQLFPASSEVAPGAVFDLELRVPAAGSAFNGFDAVIGFDPAALTLIPLSPLSLQQGTLMSGACGNIFHRFTPGTNTATIADVLLCAGVSVTGPGQIYRLRFQASNTPQVTQVTFQPGLQFYNAGLFVNPAHSSDATIGIGVSLGADARIGAGKLTLRVAPNPAPGRAAILIEGERAGPVRMFVLDIRGRIVRRLEDTLATSGRTTLVWDGRDMSGRAAPAGLYLVTVESGGRSTSSRVSLVR